MASKTLPLASILLICAAVVRAQEPVPADAPVEAVTTTALAPDAEVVEDTDPPVVLLPVTLDATFEDALDVRDPLLMQGIIAERMLWFDVPPTWELRADPEIHLKLDHSETLLPRRSALTVLVNNRAIGSTFLDETNASMGEYVARIPRELLRTDGTRNQITLITVQHYTTECEDPFDPNLWTRVSTESFLRFDYQPVPVVSDLALLPAPFVSPHALGAARMTLIATDGASSATLDALGTLGLSFGRLADYRTVRLSAVVPSVDLATTDAVIVGAYDSHPDIARLLSGLDLGSDGDGIVALVPNPSNPSLAVLVVSGRTEAGVRSAAFAVGGDDRHELLSGPVAVLKDVEPAYAATRRHPMPAPHVNTFTLADMVRPDSGIDPDISVRGYWSDPVRLPLGLEGDAQPRIDSAEMTLRYGYSAQLDTRLSTVEVSLGGVVLASEALNKPEGDQDASLRVRLPPELIDPNSAVIVRFHLFPKDYQACERVSDRIVWGTVYGRTQFTIERDHYAMMPDLGRLEYDLWPFTMEGEQGKVTIIAPDVPTAQDAAAAFTVAAALGRKRTVETPRLSVVTATDAGQSLPLGNLILLESGSPNRVYASLLRDGWFGLQENADGKVLGRDGGVLVDVRAQETYGLLEEIRHPSSDDNAILALNASSPLEILALAQSLDDDATLAKLDGDVAVIPRLATADVRTVHEAAQKEAGSRPVNTRVAQALAAFGPLFLLLLVGTAVLYALIISLWARRHGAHT